MNKEKYDRLVKDDSEMTIGKVVKIVLFAILGILIVTTFFDSFYIVNAGERAIILTLGKPSEMPSSEGFHWKTPFFQQVVYMDIKTRKYEATASAASKDLQVVSTNIAVNYHLTGESVPMLYKTIGVNYESTIIQPAVQEVVKMATAQFTAEELITKRDLVKEKIDLGLKDRLLDKGINMETTSITNFDFSAQFNQAIEQKVTAEQQALTAKNKLAQVEYEAQQLVAQANGTATAKILNAEAEAKALELQKTQITPDLILLRQVEVQKLMTDKWNGVLPQYMFGNTIPLMQMPMNSINNG